MIVAVIHFVRKVALYISTPAVDSYSHE